MTRRRPPRPTGVAGPGWSRREFVKTSAAIAAALVVGSRARRAWALGNPLVVDVANVPVPLFTASNRHPGVEVLLRTLACAGVPFYRAAASHPWADPDLGLVAPDDVVLVKVNGQWQYRGVTNSDVVRGLVQRVLDHPDGFRGEVVIVENGQGWGSLDCDLSWPGRYPDNETHANAEDETHSFRYLIDSVFADPRVSGYLLDPIRRTWIAADDHVTDGYRQAGFVSYPCFTTANGTRVEAGLGVWDGAAHRDRLTLLNVPVFKHHGGSAITGALKHVYGLLSMDGAPGTYHYARIGDATGDMHSLVLPPILNVVDCIWVSPGDLAGYPPSNTVRTNRLLAGFDPVALDYHAGKHVLHAAGGDPYHDPDRSADFQAFLTQARDRINANGGLRGEEVTFDEALFDVVTADASATTPAGTLRVAKDPAGTRLEWAGGDPPFRVWRAASPDLSDAVLLTDCCAERTWLDPGTLGDGRTWHYVVE